MDLKIFFDVMAIFLAVNIIFWFMGALYYGVKIIFLFRKRKQKLFFMTLFPLIVSLLFIFAFLYIIICSAIGTNIIDNSSFGAIVIRPLILMTAVGTATGRLEQYRRERDG